MNIVIVGGGFGGVKTALELANKPNIKVTLIAPTSNFEYHGALYRSATGRSPLEVVIRMSDIFAHATNVTFVLDAITTIDAKRNIVIGSTGHMYDYDAVVLAMGNQVNYFGIEGMAQHAATMITVPSAIDLRSRLVGLAKSKVQSPKIVVIGAGPTGVELAGDLQNFTDMVCKKYSLGPKKVHVTLVEGAQQVLPRLNTTVGIKAARRLKKLGVHIMLDAKVVGCTKTALLLGSGELKADIAIWTAGSKPIDFYGQHPHLFTLDRGLVIVDLYMRTHGSKNIYVIGDNARTKYTGMAQTSLHDALFVARNFVRLTQGKQAVTYRARHPIYVVPIGPRWAVLQTRKSVVSGYRGWLVRRQADLWIFKNFEPYKRAIKQWRKGNRIAKF